MAVKPSGPLVSIHITDASVLLRPPPDESPAHPVRTRLPADGLPAFNSARRPQRQAVALNDVLL